MVPALISLIFMLRAPSKWNGKTACNRNSFLFQALKKKHAAPEDYFNFSVVKKGCSF
jgi:hypothetical protein